MMRRLTTACLLCGFALVPAVGATTITLSTYRFSPTVTTIDGSLVEDGLVRIGTLTGTPAGTRIEDIDLVFSEFETSATRAGGLLGDTVTNPAASRFDGLPIFVWILDAPAIEFAKEHALLSVPSLNPAIGDAWYFPVHVGSGTDAATIHLPEFFSIGDGSFTPGIQLEDLGPQSQNLTLALSAAIPEPHGAALVVGGAMLILLLSRRRTGGPL